MTSPPSELNGRYKIVRAIGSGAFGAVFEAHDSVLDRSVAIKLLTSGVAFDVDSLARFAREAKSMASLKHRNLVSVYSHGVYDGAPYMVLEFVSGEALSRILVAGALPLRRAAHIMRQVCDGMECAHAHGVVHRDLKPDNILVSRSEDGSETAKVIDFGLAQLMPNFGYAAQKLTRAGETVGTPAYMPPEQCLGHATDHRADIYAAGCIFFECLTGLIPYMGADDVAIMAQQLDSATPNLSDFLPKSESLELAQHILEKAMRKDATQRYQSAADMAADLVALGNICPSEESASVPAIKPSRKPSRTATRALPAAALTLVGTAVLLFVMLRQPEQRPQKVTGPSSLVLWQEATRLYTSRGKHGQETVEAIKAAISQSERDRLLDHGRLLALYRALAAHYDEHDYPPAEQLANVQKLIALRDSAGKLGDADPEHYRDDLRELKAHIVTHNMDSAKKVADRIYRLAAIHQYPMDAAAYAHLHMAEQRYREDKDKKRLYQEVESAIQVPGVLPEVQDQIWDYLQSAHPK